MKKITFNKTQKKALAEVLDNLGSAVMIAMLLGIFIDSKITWANGLAMTIFAVACFAVATLLRSGGDD